MAHGLEAINWAAPWLAPYRQLGQALAQAVQNGASVAQALNLPHTGLWHVAQTARPAQTAQTAQTVQTAHLSPLCQPPAAAHAAPDGMSDGRSDGMSNGASNEPPGRASIDWAAIKSGVPEFVPQAALPSGVGYEPFIAAQRQVPTRDGLHDFFNGLCWWHFPRTKARLNAWQAQHIAAQTALHTAPSARGAVRDALTLFDENAALLLAPAALWQALRAQDWHTLFVRQRGLWQTAQLVLFGHALLEKLVHPRKPITAHVLVLPHDAAASWPTQVEPPAAAQHAAAPALHAWDALLAQALSAEGLRHKPFTPLPVLGVPGWWPANAESAFYADPSVFRPPRSARA